jgi:alkylation response protein AidB-like acyl-CoA dehydrogenase
MKPQQARSADAAVETLISRVVPIARQARCSAQSLDREGRFPSDDLTALQEAGALRAVLPTLSGGLGIGTEPERAHCTASLLHLIGGGSIALGRIYEAHLNAIRLVIRSGNATQKHAAAIDVHDGHLHALWVTDGPVGLCYRRNAEGIELTGEKLPCSAAGYATRAIVTATDPDGNVRLLRLKLNRGEVVRELASGLQGVRSSITGRVDFTGVRQDADAVIGSPGDYLREPDFSAGAWRTSAVTVGALTALVEAVRAELVDRDRAYHPQQCERLGRMFIHAKTANLWLRHVAPIAEDPEQDPAFTIATVNLGRIAIEAACLETLQLVQRSLGMSAFMQSNPVERMSRDLGTYLRQPAPDEALCEAAGYFAGNPEGVPLN